jgi:integrase
MGDWLQEGKIAQVGESATVGDVIFTIDEVVYRDRGIYGVGTARVVDSKNVLVPMDMADDWAVCSRTEEGEALIALAEYNKRPYDIAYMDMTFEEAFEVVFRSHAEGLTEASAHSYLMGFQKCDAIKKMKMRDIKVKHLQDVVDSISHHSKSSQMNLIKVFHMVFNYATANDIIDKDYSKFVKATSKVKPKGKTPFMREDIKRMWDDPEYYAPILILIYTGLRIQEYLNLTKKDIDLDRRIIEVHGTKTASAERLVPIHKDIIPLFQYDTGIGKEYNAFVYRFFKRKLDTLGVKHTPHECRHTFATLAKESGLDPYYVKKIMGHISDDLTEDVYTHTYEETLIKQINNFHL